VTFEEKLELLASMHVEADRRHEEWREKMEQDMSTSRAEYDAWRAEHEKRQAEDTARLQREQEKTEATLRRAIRLAVREARNERKRRQSLTSEFDQKMTQLAAAQLLTEEKLQQFIDSMKRGGNGQRA
jgi:hypothetical protein